MITGHGACAATERLLMKQAEGRATTRECISIEVHLEGCAACREAAEAFGSACAAEECHCPVDGFEGMVVRECIEGGARRGRISSMAQACAVALAVLLFTNMGHLAQAATILNAWANHVASLCMSLTGGVVKVLTGGIGTSVGSVDIAHLIGIVLVMAGAHLARYRSYG